MDIELISFIFSFGLLSFFMGMMVGGLKELPKPAKKPPVVNNNFLSELLRKEDK